MHSVAALVLLLLCLCQRIESVVVVDARYHASYRILDPRNDAGFSPWPRASFTTMSLSSLGGFSQDSDEGSVRRKLSYLTECLHGTAANATATSPLFSPFYPPPAYETLRQHYISLLDATAPYRSIKWHGYADFSGPWLEHAYLRQFFSKPFSWWYPLVPIFVQLTDVAAQGANAPGLLRLVELLREGGRKGRTTLEEGRMSREGEGRVGRKEAMRLRDDVIYVIVTQYDTGPLSLIPDPTFFENFLVFSSGGWGNVPLPLLKGDSAWAAAQQRQEKENDMKEEGDSVDNKSTAQRRGGGGGGGGAGREHRRRRSRQHILSFSGRVTYESQLGIPPTYQTLRQNSIAHLQAILPPKYLTVEAWSPSLKWKDTTAASAMTLAYRGYGATSFRLYEALHLGSVPIYAWAQLAWLPYGRSQRPLWGEDGVAFVVP